MSNTEVTPEMIHDRLYYVAKSVIAVLEKHNIPYSLAYGTLLGAVRHQGFIPWDDDFDLWLFNDSYNEAIEALRNELPDDVFLEDEKSEPNYFHGWAHAKDLRSEVTYDRFPQDAAYKHHGLQIDLFRCTLMKESEIWKFFDNENRKYLDRRKSKGLMSDEEYNVRMEKLRQDEEAHASFNGNPDKNVYTFVDERKYIDEEGVFPLVRYKFMDSEFLGFNDADKILTAFYGDYMKLPPVEDRVRLQHHGTVRFL